MGVLAVRGVCMHALSRPTVDPFDLIPIALPALHVLVSRDAQGVQDVPKEQGVQERPLPNGVCVRGPMDG